jgi:filamentous hemagglutinin
VAALTGFRFLDDYRSDDEQYKALMNAGITFGQAYQLRPGIALSPAQVAQLTSDMVWLVAQTVTLPDGSTTTALVPQVYLAPKAGDLANNGQLFAGGGVISANEVRMTQQTRGVIADGAESTSRAAGVVAAGATTVAAQGGPYGKPAQAVAVGATAIGVAADVTAYLLTPNPEKFIREQLGVGTPASVLSERYPLWAPIINEVAERLKKEIAK